jgi:DUF1009 family protein
MRSLSGGVLAKGPKPGQELRVDMPAIGPRTVELAAEAGLAGIAAEAGAVLLLDRAEALRAADARGLAVEGLRSADMEQGPRRGVPSPVVGEGQGGGESPTARSGVPPAPNPSPQGGGESERRSCRPLRIVGRVQTNARAVVDIDKGLAAVACLAPFGAGEAVVVARAHLLAIAAAEPTLALLERVRALRQWGVGARRRVGVLVCRAGAAPWDAGRVAALLERAAAAGLAGVAVAGAPEALAAFRGAGGLADRHGLVLATQEEGA